MVQYKCIAGFPRYKVGDDGSVWSRCRRKNGKWEPLKPRASKLGHLRVTLFCVGRKPRQALVHHLVLEAFVGPRPDEMECCHFPDRNPANNNLTNLRWDTRAGNRADMQIHGTLLKGEAHGSAKLTEQKVLEIRRRFAGGETQTSLAVEFDVSQPLVGKIVRRVTWKHV